MGLWMFLCYLGVLLPRTVVGRTEVPSQFLRCMPFNATPTYQLESQVVSRDSDGRWYTARVTSVQGSTYQIQWVGTSTTVSKGYSDLRTADICSCFVNRGNCSNYVVGKRGIFCDCAFSQDNGFICVPNGNFDAAELKTVVSTCPTAKSAGAQDMINFMCSSGSAQTARCDSTDNLSIGLGVGLGLGIPLCLCCVCGCIVFSQLDRTKPQDQPMQQLAPPTYPQNPYPQTNPTYQAAVPYGTPAYPAVYPSPPDPYAVAAPPFAPGAPPPYAPEASPYYAPGLPPPFAPGAPPPFAPGAPPPYAPGVPGAPPGAPAGNYGQEGYYGQIPQAIPVGVPAGELRH